MVGCAATRQTTTERCSIFDALAELAVRLGAVTWLATADDFDLDDRKRMRPASGAGSYDRSRTFGPSRPGPLLFG
jgi:hypothetical protein